MITESHPFTLVALAQGTGAGIPVVVAASLGGGLGVLDLEPCADLARARRAITALVAHRGRAFGVKCAGDAMALIDWLIEEASPAVSTVLLTPGPEAMLGSRVHALRRGGRQVAMTVTSVEQADQAMGLGVDVLIAKGHEAGGWVGEETTFVLLQRLLARASVPVWAQGGIGARTVAACSVAGAAGAVLDSQLLLLDEVALPAEVRAALARMDGSETVTVGGRLGAPYRLFAQPRRQALEELRALEVRLEAEPPVPERLVRWREAVEARVGFQDDQLWPLGQDGALAAAFVSRFGTVAAAMAGLRRAARELGSAARSQRALDAGGPLASSHGTRYPILQGPMTRVSDTPAFAERVADEGALPFLALALLRGSEVQALLEETRRRLGGRPWGVGILGFVPAELREEQFRVIEAVRPPFALIAGGRPDQALVLEQHGIRTYLHVPSPGLLGMFLEAGARCFVFEGRECGGHVGPRASFVLWEQMIEVLLDRVPPSEAEACHVVFAGGIHDERSAAMVATLAAPLAERGMRVGILLGTAYLFTQEAVASGAITQGFQSEALRCERTVLLETGPGHATRCVDTPFVQAFTDEKRRLSADPATTPHGMREALETLNLGRLRLAAKGVTRGAGGPAATRLVAVDADTQRAEGMFMIGQVAALRDRAMSVGELHRSVSSGAMQWLEAREPAPECSGGHPSSRPADVAIIGMSTLLPKAPDLQRFWGNVLGKVDAVTEVPPERWDWRRYYDPDPKVRDKVYSRWGGFVDPIVFDPVRYGMPPASLRSIEPVQLLTLEVVRAALADAGYADRPFARERAGVVIGVGGGSGDLGQQYAVRANLPAYVQGHEGLLDQLPEWTEDSFAGILLNVVAGRVANRFDLGGVNYTVDAACASSLAAVYLAVRELEAGTADMMIVGGADTVQNPFAYLCFSKTHALSPAGRCRTFDAKADGIAISEGIAVLVLKRLEDAERDGDRIYAVIKAVAGSSDGRDRGLTAPRPEGQVRALERAYARAGFGPRTVGLVEAHGTGTVAGDHAEVESLTRVFTAAGAQPASCAVGSVKSMIGHTKCTAGAAGLVKVALALHHRVLPPTLHVTEPNPKAFPPSSPFYVNTETRPWVASPQGVPRRAGVSSFGFGGTNFHALVEEYAPGQAAAASQDWTAELFVLSAPDRPALLAEATALGQQLASGAAPALRDLAQSLWLRARQRQGAITTLAVVAGSLDDLRDNLRVACQALESGRPGLQDPRGIYFTDAPLGRGGALAFLYPGQGSQQVGMLGDLAVQFVEVREALARADATLAGRLPAPLSRYIFPPPAFTDGEAARQQAALTETHVAQPALGAVGVGLTALLAALGIEPDMLAGHSYGEYVALHVGGAMDEATLFALSEARGRAILDSARGDLGGMAAVQADQADTARALDGLPEVWIANLNAPTQTMISGTRPGLEEALRRLRDRGIRAQSIAVACGFHSPLVGSARDALAARLAEAPLGSARLPVFANSTGMAYPRTAGAVAALLAEHLVEPVRFADQVEQMYEAGARVFVEVGPRSVLTRLVQDNLGNRPHLAVAPGAKGRGGLWSFLTALGQLFAHGVPLALDRLFQGRGCHPLDLDNLVEASRPAPVPATAWMVHGGRAWPAREPIPVPPAPRALAAADGPARDARGGQVPRGAGEPAALNLAESRLAGDGGHAAPEGPRPAPGGVARVMAEFQRLQVRFLETQRAVMLAYLRGAGPGETPRPGPMEDAAQRDLARDVVATTPAHAAVADTPLPAEAARPVPGGMPVAAGPEDLAAALVGIVSDRTGYPAEMLGLDLDMEADLGIDSIKRVEILGAFRRVQGGGAGPDVLERLTRAKTLRQVLELAGADEAPTLPASAPVMESAGVAAAAPTAAPPLASDEGGVPRWLPQPVAAPLLDGDRLSLPPGPVVVTDDGAGVALAVKSALGSAGIEGVLLRHRPGQCAGGPDAYDADLSSPADIERALAAIGQAHGPVVGLIHLLPLRQRPSEEARDLTGWRREFDLDVTSLYGLARSLGRIAGRQAHTPAGLVLAATAMDGQFGVDGGALPHPTQGGVAGFVKALALEWPDWRCRVVDLAPGLQAEVIAARLVKEAASGGPVEVGYRDGRRVALALRPAPLSAASPESCAIDSSWVILVTGGARGITAEVAAALAERHKPTLVIVGRSPLPPPEEAADTAELKGQDLRRALVAHLAQDGARPRPAQVEAAAARLLRDRQMRACLGRMSQAGATVHYHQVDMRDEPAVTALLDALYAEHGRIDAVIHGAGIIEDRLVVDKSPDSYDRVVHSKLDGAFILARRLDPATTRLVVFFSSIAARFGNRGQADYAAANEVLNKLAVHLDQAWPTTRVVALGWGPWGGTGMVSDAVERQFHERGVQVIDPAAGRRAGEDEMRLGPKGHAEVILGGGRWETAPGPAAVVRRLALPLLNGSVPTRDAAGALLLTRSLDPAHDVYLGDHRLDGRPVFPAAMAMELMAEVVQHGWPDWQVVGLRSLSVLRGIVLGAEPGSIHVKARPVARAGDAPRLDVEVEIVEARAAATPSYRGTVELRRGALGPALAAPATPALDAFPLSVREAYERWLFHGPALQAIRAIEGMDEEWIAATLAPSDPARLVTHAIGPWLIDPALVDGAFQLAILWVRARHDVTPLPARLGAYRRLAATPGGTLRCHLRARAGAGASSLVAQVTFADDRGQVVAALEDMEFSCSRALNRLGGQGSSPRGTR